jgi:hypothetical protein
MFRLTSLEWHTFTEPPLRHTQARLGSEFPVQRHARAVEGFGSRLLSRLSRRLEIRERRRTGRTMHHVSGLEDQVAGEPA